MFIGVVRVEQRRVVPVAVGELSFGIISFPLPLPRPLEDLRDRHARYYR